MKWHVVFTKQAQHDAKKLASSGLKDKAEELLALLQTHRFNVRPFNEKWLGDLAGACSRRINIQHRCIYQVLTKEKVVKILRMWTYYE